MYQFQFIKLGLLKAKKNFKQKCRCIVSKKCNTQKCNKKNFKLTICIYKKKAVSSNFKCFRVENVVD